MCFIVSQKATKEKIKADYNSLESENLKEWNPQDKISGFSFPILPVIHYLNGSQTQMSGYHWGLIPEWVKTESEAKEIRSKTLNARCETLFELPSFATSILWHRCIIPITGFYEFQHINENKYRYSISPVENAFFSVGGIFAEWVHPEKRTILKTFSIITTEANPLMAQIHNTKKRMPLLLSKENSIHWLNPELSNDNIQKLIQPYPDKFMKATADFGEQKGLF